MSRATLVLLACFALFAASCDGGSDAPAEAAAVELYTCGMHPAVVNEGPGSCPICGMDLTPMGRTAGGASTAPSGERKIKYWAAPMDPTFIADKPGKSPMGMDLVPVYEDEAPASGSLVSVDPIVVQNMGVRIAPVKKGPIFRHVRTLGEIEVAEDEISVVNLRYSGWIEKIRVDATGVEVKRGQTLFEIYSPEVVAAQDELLLSLRSEGGDGPRSQGARTRLRNWDVPQSVIDKVVREGKSSRSIPVLAPRSGYVLHKAVVEGARINAGTDLYRIGDLKSIWVRTEVYEQDAAWVK